MEGKQDDGSTETEDYRFEIQGKEVRGDRGRTGVNAGKREDVYVQAEAGRGVEKMRDVRKVSAQGDSQTGQKVLLRPMPR